MAKTIKCSECPKMFKREIDMSNHYMAKHCGYEPSVASLMVEAEIDLAMGEPVENWILEMLP